MARGLPVRCAVGHEPVGRGALLEAEPLDEVHDGALLRFGFESDLVHEGVHEGHPAAVLGVLRGKSQQEPSRSLRWRTVTVVLAVLLAAAVVAAAAFGTTWLRSRGAVRRAGEQVSELTQRLGQSGELVEQVEQQKRSAEVRATAAEGRARVAEQKAGDAERRAGDAERRVGEAMRRAEEAEKAGANSEAARAVWELERLRVQREWLDVVGPGVSLPVPWDGTIAAVVATELSVIREVIGTPSELTVQQAARPSSPARAAVTARVSVELLRTLARSGEEMQVVLSAEALTVGQPSPPGETPPDLAELARVADDAGLQLTVEAADGRSTARLVLA